MLVLSS